MDLSCTGFHHRMSGWHDLAVVLGHLDVHIGQQGLTQHVYAWMVSLLRSRRVR